MAKKVLFCGDVVPGCEAKFEADTLDGVMAQVAKHAGEAHGLATVDAETARKAQAAVRDA